MSRKPAAEKHEPAKEATHEANLARLAHAQAELARAAVKVEEAAAEPPPVPARVRPKPPALPEVKPKVPEPQEQQSARHFLRRWLTAALIHGELPQNLHVGDEGASRDQLLGIAKRHAQEAGISSDLITGDLLVAAVASSGGAITLSKHHVAGKRMKAAAEPEPDPIAVSKKSATDRTRELQARYQETGARIRQQTERHKAAHAARKANAKRGADELKAAMRLDDRNSFRVADPNDHSKLASKAPAIDRLTQGRR